MSDLIALEVHYDRTVVSLLLTEPEARSVELAVIKGEAVSVRSRNWVNKNQEVGIHTINGKRVNYLLAKPDVANPF